MTERLSESQERIPTYDSFGDPDEALAWVLNRLNVTYKAEGVQQWWTTPKPQLDGLIPEVLWDHDPNQVIRVVAQIEN